MNQLTISPAPVVSRRPQQGRSKASLERMLSAARELMLESGSNDFTLLDVSRRGKVSVGSIYLRFESKDILVRAVVADMLEDFARDEERMLGKLVSRSGSLPDFIPRYVAAFSELLHAQAPFRRIAMQRALCDPQVCRSWQEAAERSRALAVGAMLAFVDEIGGADKEGKAASAYHVINATLTREFGSRVVSPQRSAAVECEIGRMCLAYLQLND